jgi:polysaccharide biosynthesis protein PslH
MRILWACPTFLHPTTRGGQIRTLETLKQLHRWHEIHFVALDRPDHPEGPSRAAEYSSYAYPVEHRPAGRGTLTFYRQLAGSLFSPVPLAVSRWASQAMRNRIAELEERFRFDAVVCDFLAAAPNIPRIGQAILFQHNVEATIWDRHAAHGRTPLHRLVFRQQARRMWAYERRICRESRYVIAVSEPDAERMRQAFQIGHVADVPTGVDTEYFAPPASAPPAADLVFVGSMDWMPNIDGVSWFVREVLPRVHARRPETTVAIVGRTPPREIEAFGQDARVRVTGTVPDIRPYFWGSAVSIVPLRVGGGTRLKIFEAMAAGIPVVSTAIGAEGLPVEDGRHLRIADEPEAFAQACLGLLSQPEEGRRLAAAARQLVVDQFSWEQAARQFERLLSAPSR